MNPPPDPDLPGPRRSWRVMTRFSLLSLLFAVLLGHLGYVIWLRWEAWTLERILLRQHEIKQAPDESWDSQTSVFTSAHFSLDGSRLRILTTNRKWRAFEIVVWNTFWTLDLQGEKGLSREHIPFPSGLAIYPAPDKRYVMTQGSRITIRDSSNWKERFQLEASESFLAFSPNGRTFLTAYGTRYPVTLWDTGTGKKLQVFTGDGLAVSAVFSPDGRKFLAFALGQTARLCDVQSGQEQFALQTPGAWINSAAFSADSRLLLTACADGRLRLWGVRTGTLLREYPGVGYIHSMYSLQRSGVCLIAARDGWVRVFDMETGETRIRFSPQISGEDRLSLQMLPDSRDLLVCNVSGQVWDVHKGKLIFEGEKIADLSPDGKSILTMSDAIRLYRRRHPEWWGGHFYRPEVWAFILVASLWLFLLIRRRRKSD